MNESITIVPTEPFENTKPGTSGLRKSVTTFQQEHYTENFVQATLNALGNDLEGCSLVLGGDGRFFGRQCTKTIIKMCAANGVKRLLVGQNGIMSTPAISCVIRKKKLLGGFILTASHNPGGPDGDFGIKYNVNNGGPAPLAVTDSIYRNTKTIKEYRICRDLDVDISKVGETKFLVEGLDFVVVVIDPVQDYALMLKQIFDFKAISNYLHSGPGDGDGPGVVVDAMSGVMGPYVKRVFVHELGLPANAAINCEPKPDFGGSHPDPNLTYGKDLVKLMLKGKNALGVAFDGDGDRNMILGRNGFFVTPCDSLAVIADNLDAIPYFEKRQGDIAGFARSMPTSKAVDHVAKAKGLTCFEVPTGWKFFGNLMDAGKISLCGEESFGTGSDHIREKDGMWAALAWLSILAKKRKDVAVVIEDFWFKYGRYYFTRYDYEDCQLLPCEKMINSLRETAEGGKLEGKWFHFGVRSYQLAKMDDFSYEDPVDRSVTSRQGIRLIFVDGSRIIFRLSGTGSSGATVRLYVETYASSPFKVKYDAQEYLEPLVKIAMEISKLPEYTGRNKPTVIT